MPGSKQRLRRAAAAGVVFVFAIPTVVSAKECGGSAWAKPYGWGPESSGGSTVFGRRGYHLRYTWKHSGNVETYVCVQARGFDEEGREHWYRPGVGCGKSGGSGTVPWGNNAAVPKLRARSAGPNGVVIPWGCADNRNP